MSFFEVGNLSISFGGLQALLDISFEVKQGSIFAIIGPNGAGKTTLFNCISGIYRPDEGRILYKGSAIQGRKPHRIARMGIGRTFQNIELFDHMNTMENIMLGRHVHIRAGLFRGIFMWGFRSFAGKEEIAHRGKVEEVIDLLDLESVRNKLVGALPYGTQKRVELGRALVDLGWELVSWASFLLMAIAGGIAAQAALRYLTYAFSGAMAILGALAILYTHAGSLEYSKVLEALASMTDGQMWTLLLMMGGGFVVKMGLLPFHLWQAEAYAETPGPGSAFR